MPDLEPLPLEFDELLAAEYDYIATTLNQANEDRARVHSYYLIAVGTLVAALFLTQFFDPGDATRDINISFSGIFALMTLLGTFTILQLARLRASWYESTLAMNQLKEYMISTNKNLVKAFRWNTSTLPSKYKKDSSAYYQAMEVALISGLMAGAAAFFFQRAFFAEGLIQWIVAALTGLITIFIQLFFYRRAL